MIQATEGLNIRLYAIEDVEEDAALGNGGLGLVFSILWQRWEYPRMDMV